MGKERYLIRVQSKPIGESEYECLYLRGILDGEFYFNEDPKLARSFTWEKANELINSERFTHVIEIYNRKANAHGDPGFYPVVVSQKNCKMSNQGQVWKKKCFLLNL